MVSGYYRVPCFALTPVIMKPSVTFLSVDHTIVAHLQKLQISLEMSSMY